MCFQFDGGFNGSGGLQARGCIFLMRDKGRGKDLYLFVSGQSCLFVWGAIFA